MFHLKLYLVTKEYNTRLFFLTLVSYFNGLVSMVTLFELFIIITLILPTPKVIRFCHQYRAKSACTSVQSDQALYFWLTNF